MTINAEAQWVTIPDPQFVNWLNNNGFSSCMNGNQLDSSDPLVLNTNTVICSNANISDLSGIAAFSNLQYLKANNNNLTYLPSLPSTLTYLEVEDNNLNSLGALPASLWTLKVKGNNLTWITGLPNMLYDLDISDNPLGPQLGFNLPQSLYELKVENCQLTSLPTVWPQGFYALICSNNFLQSIPPLPSTMIAIECEYNLIQSLPPLPLGFQSLFARNNNLDSLPALPSTMIHLDVRDNNLDTLIALPSSLEQLDCARNLLTSLPPLPVTLDRLYCSANPITSLPQLPSALTVLICDSMLLDSLPVLPASLEGLYCSSNNLTSLPQLPSALRYLVCRHQSIASLPVLPLNLSTLICSSNPVTVLPAFPSSLHYIDISSLQISDIPPLPATLSELHISDNPGIYCLPAANYIGYLNWNNTSINCLPNNVSIAGAFPFISNIPICDVINSGGCPVYWNIKGSVFNDINSDCVFDSTETTFSHVKLNIYNGAGLYKESITSSLGEYSFTVPNNFYFYNVDTTGQPYIVTCPSAFQYTDSITTLIQNISDKNFSLECKPGFDNAFESIITQGGMLRPASTRTFHVNAGDRSSRYGMHCSAGISGSVRVVLNGPVSYVGPATGALLPTVNGDTLDYLVADFGLLNSYNDLAFELAIDTSAQLNDQVCFDVSVLPLTGDYDTTNNSGQYCFIVVNSFDPNNKLVNPVGAMDTSTYWLTYTINFQNTGNAPAQNVFVRDTLSNLVDVSTLEVISSSHDYSVNIHVSNFGKVVVFNFPGINLPDSVSNEPLSHGYVQYKVKRKPGLSVGMQIWNKAYIFFDFNPPVVTNTTINEIYIPSTVGVGEQQSAGWFKIYPNPLSSGMELKFETDRLNNTASEISIYDTRGRKILSQKLNPLTNKGTIMLPALSSGIFIFELQSGGERIIQKLVLM